MQHPPLLKRFSSTYDDPFSDVLSTYDQPAYQEPTGPESPNISNDHKLLSFSPPIYHFTLLDYAYRPTQISMSAQLHGMFFLAESPWATPGDSAPPPTELTCYRRNLFQITGQVTLPRALRYIANENGEQFPILAQELTVSATESVEGNAVKIISVPWKTPAANMPVVEDKTEKEPPSISLDLMNGQDMDSEYVNFPIAWKRLQFRIATANNGRRKELQQHFIVRLKVVATLPNGGKYSIAEIQSGAIIVRGRSPRNFQSRKDHPIGGSTASVRKAAYGLPAQPQRTATGDSGNNNNTGAPSTTSAAGAQSKPELPSLDVPQIPFPYEDSNLQVSPDFFVWQNPLGRTGARTARPMDTQSSFPNLQQGGVYAQSSPGDITRSAPSSGRQIPAAPIKLSLTEEEPKKSNPESPSTAARKAPRMGQVPPRPPSFSINLISSPDESADLLYEYFPLGLDDWMPPVDAVYRPHVVHHLTTPSDPKALAGKTRSKRYFAGQGEDE